MNSSSVVTHLRANTGVNALRSRRRPVACKTVWMFRDASTDLASTTPASVATKPPPLLETSYDEDMHTPIMYHSQAMAVLQQRIQRLDYSSETDMIEEPYCDWSWFPTEAGSAVHTSAMIQTGYLAR